MTAEQFCFWLQGAFEMNPSFITEGLTPDQTKIVQAHLHLAFVHDIDPRMGDAKHQAALNDIHSKAKPPSPIEIETKPFKPTNMRC